MGAVEDGDPLAKSAFEDTRATVTDVRPFGDRSFPSTGQERQCLRHHVLAFNRGGVGDVLGDAKWQEDRPSRSRPVLEDHGSNRRVEAQ